MSVLICSLCEANRNVVTKALDEAIQALGRNATGLSPFLGKLICQDCNNAAKQFDYTYYIGRHIRFIFQISSNQKGEYSIRLKDYNTSSPDDINLLAIINRIKSQLDVSNYEFDETARIFVDQQSGVRIFCKCGNSIFKTE